MFTLYAKKVPITRADLPGQFPLVKEEINWMKKQYSVQIFRDKAATKHAGTFLFDHSNKPTKRNKYVMLNCYRWKLVWIDTLTLNEENKVLAA